MRGFLTYVATAILIVVFSTTARAQDTKKPKAPTKPVYNPLRLKITDPAVTTFGGAMPTDVKQGDAPTCWIVASIAAVAHKTKDLSHLIRYQGKQQYTVALFNCNNKDNRSTGGYHRITEKVFFDGRRTKADAEFDKDQPGESWVIIMQRAIVQAVARWDHTQNIKNPHGGDAADSLAILTGRRPQDVSVKDSRLQQKVIGAVATGKTIVYGTTDKAKTLVAGHYFAVLAADKQGVTLYNPWGSVTTATWTAIRKDGDDFYILGN